MQFYIDPGTGSMLFTIAIGLISAGAYALRSFLLKLRFYLGGGRQSRQNEDALAYAIFTDDKRYWNVFEPICDEFEARGVEVSYFTASGDDPALGIPYDHVRCEFVGEGNKAFAKMNMLKADIVLSSTPGLDVYQWKRSRDVKAYVHVLHAVSDAAMYRMFGLDYYDAVLLSGNYQANQIRELERLRGLPSKDLPVVGMPYMDSMLVRFKDVPSGESQGNPTVLLAPSWGKSSIFNLYGESIIKALLATGYHVVIRPHPQSFTSEREMLGGLMSKYPSSEQLEWNDDNDNFAVLYRADILISDFSGVIFDYALVFDRPVIYTEPSYDKGPYDAWWLEEELWTFKVLPKIGAKLEIGNLANMKGLIDDCLRNPSFKQGREEARDDCWANRGLSAKAIVDYLVARRNEELAS